MTLPKEVWLLKAERIKQLSEELLYCNTSQSLGMMTGPLLRTWKSVKQHIPLIKFKKGGPFRENTPSAGSLPLQDVSRAAGGALSKAQQVTVIEDWQLPPYYRRAPLDEKEIDAINSGGAF